MKKFVPLFIILLFLFSSMAHALSWAYPFVVWKGKVYEVKHEDSINKNKLGRNIGKVKTQPNDMTGKYLGIASNYFPIGTKYYEINGISPTSAIAVEINKQEWIKAVYVNRAPFHVMNVFSIPKLCIGLILIIVIVIIIKRRQSKKNN